MLPVAALDGSEVTEWVAGADEGVARWEVVLDGTSAVSEVLLRGGPSAPPNQQLRVVVDQATSEVVELGAGQEAVVRIPLGRQSTGTVGVEAATAGQEIALSEVEVEGLDVTRPLVLPSLPEEWGAPDVAVLRSDLEPRRGCAEVDGDVRCRLGVSPSSEEPAGLDRVVDLGPGATWDAELLVRPQAGPVLDRLVQRDQPGSVVASTSGSDDPRAAASSTIDGDPGTTWLAAPDDLRPVLRLAWLGEKRVRGLDLRTARGTAARLPTRVEVVWPDGRRVLDLVDGRARLDGVRTDQLEVRVLQAEPASDLDFAAQGSVVPIGVGEVRLLGVPFFPLGLPTEVMSLQCGTGPDLRIDGREVRTRLVAAPAALHKGLLAPAVPCVSPEGLYLGDGPHRVSFGSSDATVGSSVVLKRRGGSVPGADVPVPAAGSGLFVGPSDRTLSPDPGGDLVTVRENTNPGWTARGEDGVLEPVVVDGWQQGWWLEPGDVAPGGVVEAHFGPDAPYQAGLVGGAAAALVLLLLLAWPGRLSTPVIGAPVDQERRLPGWLHVPAAVLAAGLVAGWVGVAIATTTLLVLRGLERADADPDVGVWLPAAPLIVAAAWYAVLPWGSEAGWAGALAGPAYLCVPALVALVSAPVVSRRSARPPASRPGRWASFSAGRSTTR